MDLTGFGVKDPEELTRIQRQENDGLAVPPQLPILPLKNTVIFPLTVLPLIVQKPRSVRLVDDAVVADRMVALVALKDPKIEEPTPDDVYQMGTMAVIHRLARASDGTLHIIVQGLERIRITEFTETEPYMRAGVEMALKSPKRAWRWRRWCAARRPSRLVVWRPFAEDVTTSALKRTTSPVGLPDRHQHTHGYGDPSADPGVNSVADNCACCWVCSPEVEVPNWVTRSSPTPSRVSSRCSASTFCRTVESHPASYEEDEQAADQELRQKIESIGMPEEAKKRPCANWTDEQVACRCCRIFRHPYVSGLANRFALASHDRGQL